MYSQSKRAILGLALLAAVSPLASAQQFTLKPLSGNGQLLRLGFQSNPLVAELTNPQGLPVPNTEIRWSVEAFGVGVSLTNTTTLTDGLGRAQTQVNPVLLQPTSSILPIKVRAEVANNASLAAEFIITYSNLDTSTGTPLVNGELQSPEESQLPLEGRAGTEGTIPIRVRVFAGGFQSGAVPNVALEIRAANDSSTAPQIRCKESNILTDNNGIATCTPVFTGALGEGTFDIIVGGGNLITFGEKRFRVLVGPLSRFDVTQGQNQNVQPGQLFPNVFTVVARDAAGNAVANEPVVWEVIPANAATLSNVSTTTDASGRASARATAGTVPGTHIVRVRTPNNSASTDFTFTVALNVSGIEKTSGDNQEAIINTQFAQPIVVTVRTPSGLGASIPVTFSVTGGSATVNPQTATTDGNGRAQATVTAGGTAGNITVRATAGNQSVTFNLSSRLPGPTLTLDSFFNAAGGQRGGVSPGALLQISGPGIAPGLTGCTLASNFVNVFTYQLASVSVNFGTTPAPIYSVCNLGQNQQYVVVQVPTTVAPGSTPVTVNVGTGNATIQNVPVTQASPGLFETVMSDGVRRAVAIRPDGTYVSLDNRARRGESLRLFVTGLGVGRTSAGTQIGTNQVAPTNTNYTTPFATIVGLNNEGVAVTSTNLSDTIVGVFEVVFTVPDSVPSGASIPLVVAAIVNDQFVFSNPSSLPVQ